MPKINEQASNEKNQNVIIVCMNKKGGVGKTTLATNLSVALGLLGKSVLLIDLDAQCDSTEIFATEPVNPDLSLLGLLENLLDHKEVNLEKYINFSNYQNVKILPNHEDSAWIENDLIGEYSLLKNSVRDYAKNNFNFTIIDTPPNIGSYLSLALNMSDFVIIPIEAESNRSVKGLSRAIESITETQKTLNPDLRFLKILLNKIDKRTIISKSVISLIYSEYDKDVIFQTTIPKSTFIQQAEGLKASVFKHANTSSGANKYRELAKELINDLSNKLH